MKKITTQHYKEGTVLDTMDYFKLIYTLMGEMSKIKILFTRVANSYTLKW